MIDSTTIVEIDLASDIKNTIKLTDDLRVDNDDVRKVIYNDADDGDLIRVVKVIGSPIRIIKADIVDDNFLKDNLIKE